MIKTRVMRGVIEYNDTLRTELYKLGNAEVCIDVYKLPLKRSKAQNRYYHSIIKKAFRTLWNEVIGGVTTDMAHEMLKRNFLPLEVISPHTGEVIMLYRSTTTLSTKEFSEFIEACRGYYLHETGEEIPLPNWYREAVND